MVMMTICSFICKSKSKGLSKGIERSIPLFHLRLSRRLSPNEKKEEFFFSPLRQAQGPTNKNLDILCALRQAQGPTIILILT